MDIKMLLVYFVIGGAVVAAAIHFGSQAKGLLAAFITFIPVISVVTILGIYFASGAQAVVSYAKGMLMLLPPWGLYVIAVIFLLPRIGLAGALLVGVASYLGIALLVMRLT